MDARAENERIWRHFQGEGRDVFSQARPRLDFLVAKVVGITHQSRASDISVLNIGVGDAYFEQRLKALGFGITGLDPNEDSMAELRHFGIGGVAAALPRTGISSKSFDVVVASEVVEHLGDGDLVPSVSEVARLLKEGGAFIGTVPYQEQLAGNAVHCPACGETFHRWGHHQSFDKLRMRELLADEFDVKRLEIRAFVDFAGRSVAGQIRGAVRYVTGRFGYALAGPNLYFQSVKR